jgi:N-acetylglucosamine kinase-like BadF-type ATPase
VGKTLFLGVDGGGTKTELVLLDCNGNLVASQSGPSCDYLQIGLGGVRDVLATGLSALFAHAGIAAGAIAHAFFGLPAHGEDAAAQRVLDALPQSLLGHRRYRCGNDMVCAWAGSLAGEDGINIVAGTGSIGYGERRGRSARAGGWGEIFGDEGSAYWIAAHALNIFSRMSDGRLPRGPLHTALHEALGLERDLDLCAKVMHDRSRAGIAALSQLVPRAARDGDGAALSILDDAARELAAIAEALRQALAYEANERVPVSYSGGVFNCGALVLEPFERYLKRHCAAYDLKRPVFAPSIGAAIHAAKLAAQPLSVAAIARLRSLT